MQEGHFYLLLCSIIYTWPIKPLIWCPEQNTYFSIHVLFAGFLLSSLLCVTCEVEVIYLSSTGSNLFVLNYISSIMVVGQSLVYIHTWGRPALRAAIHSSTIQSITMCNYSFHLSARSIIMSLTFPCCSYWGCRTFYFSYYLCLRVWFKYLANCKC